MRFQPAVWRRSLIPGTQLLRVEGPKLEAKSLGGGRLAGGPASDHAPEGREHIEKYTKLCNVICVL